MCAPGCLEHVHARLSRRGILRAAALAGAAAAGAAASAPAPAMAKRAASRFSRLVDLTHTLTPEFPTFFGTPGLDAIATATNLKNPKHKGQPRGKRSFALSENRARRGT